MSDYTKEQQIMLLNKLRPTPQREEHLRELSQNSYRNCNCAFKTIGKFAFINGLLSAQLSNVFCRKYIYGYNRFYRPVFKPNIKIDIYNQTDKILKVINGKEYFLYKANVGGMSPAYLPRKNDYDTLNKLKGNNEIDEVLEYGFTTIGHIIQWQDYIANSKEPTKYYFSKDDEEYLLIYYDKEVVFTAYNDINNLELQGNKYNSKIAYTYIRNDYPLMYSLLKKDINGDFVQV